ncbi:hypothetical protein V6N13_043160 [Hibiscus sabdariffa]
MQIISENMHCGIIVFAKEKRQHSQSLAPVSSRPLQKMGLWTILEGFLLLANALAILNEDRFLAPRGWSFSEFSAGRSKSFKGQLIASFWLMLFLI